MVAKTVQKLLLLPDIPVGEQHGSIEPLREERLNFSTYARILARAAMATSDPMTIGVFGRWGTGKTSLMRLTKHVVDREGRNGSVSVWFNAWRFEREENLLVPLIATIVRELEARSAARGTRSTKLQKDTSKLGKALQAVLFGLTFSGKMTIPGITETSISLSAKETIQRYEQLQKESVLAKSQYLDAFDQLRQIASEQDYLRIIVFIDDLDRCLPENAVQLLEGIKLVLAQPGFAFVIGVYDQIIREFVRAKYEKEYGLQEDYFKDYLDKMVQVPFYIPACSGEHLHNYITHLLDKADLFVDPAEGDRAALVPLVADACDNNPRAIVRLLNSLLISLKVSDLEDTVLAPLTLLITLALQRDKYKQFLDCLEIDANVIGAADEIKEGEATFGLSIVSLLNAHYGPDKFFHFRQQINSIAEKQTDEDVKQALRMLGRERSLTRLLASPTGREWLTQPEVRKQTLLLTRTHVRADGEANVVRWNEMVRQVKEDGADPLSFPEVIEFLRRNRLFPPALRPYVKDTTPLGKLTNLNAVNLSGCTQITDLKPLASLQRLNTVFLEGCSKISDLRPLTLLPELRELYLGGCDQLRDISCLVECRALERVWIKGSGVELDSIPTELREKVIV